MRTTRKLPQMVRRGQLVIAVKMNASQVFKEKDKLSPTAARCVTENIGLIGQALEEIRTVSYLLHPPMLEEIGLLSALAWYAEGFAQRSKVKVALELASDLGRLPEDYELSLFRVVQECLANVHRHSGSSTAAIKLVRTSKEIKLEVTDAGKGIDKHFQSKIASGASVRDIRAANERKWKGSSPTSTPTPQPPPPPVK